MIPHSSDWETLKVDGTAMRTFVARPTDPAVADVAPGVLVIQHAGGVDQFVQGMARRLAAAGFVAAAPELYHRQDPPPDEPLERMGLLRDAEIIADSEAVLDSLGAAEGAAGRPAGVVGFCMGGRAAYLLAAASARCGRRWRSTAATPAWPGAKERPRSSVSARSGVRCWDSSAAATPIPRPKIATRSTPS